MTTSFSNDNDDVFDRLSHNIDTDDVKDNSAYKSDNDKDRHASMVQ